MLKRSIRNMKTLNILFGSRKQGKEKNKEAHITRKNQDKQISKLTN